MHGLLERVRLDGTRLASLAGIAPRTLTAALQVPSQNYRRPTPSTLRKLADALDQHSRTASTEAKKLRRQADALENGGGS